MTTLQPTGRIFTAKGLLVCQTYVVQGRDGRYHYEIHLAPDNEPGAHRTILHTRNEQVYDFALLLEGKDARVDASWSHAARNGKRICVLERLEAYAA